MTCNDHGSRAWASSATITACEPRARDFRRSAANEASAGPDRFPGSPIRWQRARQRVIDESLRTATRYRSNQSSWRRPATASSSVDLPMRRPRRWEPARENERDRPRCRVRHHDRQPICATEHRRQSSPGQRRAWRRRMTQWDSREDSISVRISPEFEQFAKADL